MASSSNCEDCPLDLKATIQELTRGQEFTGRLGSRLREALPGNSATELLIEEIFGSFSRALSALKSLEGGLDPATPGFSDDRRREGSGGKRKTNPAGDRRDACRKRLQPSSLRVVTARTMEDGYTWRKYGQKEIHNKNFPRSYFRCTRKPDQGCQARRQVQQSGEDPSLLTITYLGEHTCRDPSQICHPIADPCLINFSSKAPPAPSSPFPSKRQQEHDEEVLSSLTTGSTSSEYFMLPDLTTHDVTSGLDSPSMVLMAEGFEFEDVFGFD